MSADNGFFEGIRMRDRLLGWAIIFCPLLLLIILLKIFYRPELIDPSYVFGCYAADGAPRLEVTREGMRVDQPGYLSLAYTVEPEKQGYHLRVTPTAALMSGTGGRYAFVPSDNWFYWPLLPPGYDDPRRLRHLSDYRGRFVVYAQDSRRFTYVRITTPGACF